VIDQYLNRMYRPRTYNCAHFVCDVWRDLKGEEMALLLKGFLCGRSQRKADFYLLKKHVTFLDKPETPSVVLMQRPRMPAHVGIWINRKVLQITLSGVTYYPLDIATMGYRKVRFFTCNM